ncbi:hypothetical protein ACOMHN_012312 [Nucella lapillus]
MALKKKVGSEACGAINCTNSRVKCPGKSFFRFPKEEKRCKVWVHNTGRQDLIGKTSEQLYSGTLLCEDHFEPNQFRTSCPGSTRRQLIQGAVPTNFCLPDPPGTGTQGTQSDASPGQRGHGSWGDEFGSPSVPSPAYLHWKCLGAQQGLREDRDIACFLLKYYEDTSRVLLPAGLTGVCKTCGTPLSISCTGCDWIISADTTSTSPHHGASTGGGTEERGGRGGEGRGGGESGVPPLYVPPSSHGMPVWIKREHGKEALLGYWDVKPDISYNGLQHSEHSEKTDSRGLSLGHRSDNDDDIDNSCGGGGFDDGDEGGDVSSVILDVAEDPANDGGQKKSEEHCNAICGLGAQDVEEGGAVCEQERVKEGVGRKEKEGGCREDRKEEKKVRSVSYQRTKPTASAKKKKKATPILTLTNIRDSMPSLMNFKIDVSDGSGEVTHRADVDDGVNDLGGQGSRSPASLGGDDLKVEGPSLPAKDIAEETSSPVDSQSYNSPSPSSAPSQPQQSTTSKAPQMHTESRGRPYQCGVCGKAFLWFSHYNEHVRVHSGKKRFVCKLCGTNFLTHRFMRRHMLRVHKVQADLECELCGETFQSGAALRTHGRVHSTRMDLKHGQGGRIKRVKRLRQTHSGEVFKCEECYKSFKSNGRLQMHKEMHGGRNLICDECGRSFTRLCDLGNHKKTHSIPIICEECGKTYTREIDLAKHKRNHHGPDSRSPFTCDECGKTFAMRYNLELHKKTHSNTKPFICEFCGVTFALSGYLRRHRRIHTGHRRIKCTMCEQTFTQPSSLRKHMLIHDGLKPFDCEICKKSFRSKSMLKVHLRVHTKKTHRGIKPKKRYNYFCDICGKVFSWSLLLKRHKITHLGELSVSDLNMKTHDCEVCGQKFAYPFLLRDHMVAHGSEKYLFSCEQCGKKLASHRNLQRHQKTHEGLKPYQCNVCFKYFTQAVSLRRHEIIHTGLRPFECEICKKTFADKSTLAKHMRVHRREQTAVGP